MKSSSPLEVLPSALPVTLQPSTPQPIKTISMTSTANGQRKSTPIATSSTSMMTSILEGTFRERMKTQTVSPVTTTSLKPSFVSDIQSSTARLHEETQNVSEYVDKQGIKFLSICMNLMQCHFCFFTSLASTSHYSNLSIKPVDYSDGWLHLNERDFFTHATDILANLSDLWKQSNEYSAFRSVHHVGTIDQAQSTQ